jgi:hypothetical protein
MQFDKRLNVTDNNYLNITVRNDTNNIVLAKYDETRSKVLIDNPSDYYLSVNRFDLPVGAIPIFNFKHQNNDRALPGIYSVTMVNLTNSPPEHQEYFINNMNGTGVFIIQTFIDMANTAINTACGIVGILDIPVIFFEPTTQLISIEFSNSANWLGNHLTANWQLWFNFQAFNKFAQIYVEAPFGYNGPTGKSFKVVVKDNYNGNFNGTYYDMSQEFPWVSQWTDVSMIVFTTSKLPVNKENLAAKQSNGNPIEISVITDFIPFKTNSLSEERTTLTYNANPARLIDLIGNLPIRSFDIQAFYVDNDGIFYPIYLQPSYSMSIKLAFYKKSLYSNAWNN